jgi:hypothetical protein
MAVCSIFPARFSSVKNACATSVTTTTRRRRRRERANDVSRGVETGERKSAGRHRFGSRTTGLTDP